MTGETNTDSGVQDIARQRFRSTRPNPPPEFIDAEGSVGREGVREKGPVAPADREVH